ncbi:MAG: hypothetical protein GMKNLPBB_02938 [Myxococcota bacterium]|nr:hypothetical protein [Myxococcota bacterium]
MMKKFTWGYLWTAYGRWLLLALGVGALWVLVQRSGPEQVFSAVAAASPWIPVILALEILWISMDVVAVWRLAGPRRKQVSLGEWVRTGMMAYSIMTFLPAGRAGGEIARAAGLAPHVGGPRASAAAAQLQSLVLIANFLVCMMCALAVTGIAGADQLLFPALLVNGTITLSLGSFMQLGMRRIQLGGWLGRKIEKLRHHGPEFDRAIQESGGFPFQPLMIVTLGRLFQVAQYGVLVMAVGGSLGVQVAFVAEGIHLIGAGLGDMVPNQVGITEGAFSLFRAALGFQDQEARAISIAILARLVQFAFGGVCIVFSGTPKAPNPQPETGVEPGAAG